MTVPERTLRAYLDAVAARTPTPGGGSVAAVAGALAAALGEMVANLTLGSSEATGNDDALVDLRDRLTGLRGSLIDAAAADERTYAAYRDAVKLPRGSDAETTARAAALHRTLIDATEVPLAVARSAAEVAELMANVAVSANRHVRSDAALGALLAEVALRGALLNVHGNAMLLYRQDKERSLAYLAAADRVEDDGRAAADRAYRAATGDLDQDAPFLTL